MATILHRPNCHKAHKDNANGFVCRCICSCPVAKDGEELMDIL